LAGGRFDEGERVDRRDGAVDGAADVGCGQLQLDRSEELADDLSRAFRPLFQDVLQVLKPVLDPFDRWTLEDLLAASQAAVPPKFLSVA
jgi:hypothetical protein